MELRDSFSRNMNINKDIRSRYEKIMSGFLFKDKEMKNIFMLCFALGYKIHKRKPVKDGVGLLNIRSFLDQDLWTIAAIAIKDKDDINIIKNGPEMKKIATEYAYAGLSELEDLITEYGSGINLELALEKKMQDSLIQLKSK